MCRLLLRLATVCMVCTLTSSVGNQVPATPIQNFEPSWTASSVGGTTIAIPFELKDVTGVNQNDDSTCNAVVVIFRSSIPLASSSSTYDGMTYQRTRRSKSEFILDGLHIVGPLHTTSDTLPLSHSSQRWTLLGSTAICSMTGFSPDVDYLTRYLQNLVENHRTIYESTSPSKTNLISTIKLVESLAQELQEEGQSQGGRPFGIQSLLVGQDNTMKPTSSLSIFTVDPSGVYRRWRGGAAIGRNGKNIRDRLFEYWVSPKNTNEIHDDGAEALFAGLQASVFARMEESENLERADMYEAVLIWQLNTELCVANINRAQLDEMRELILTKHQEKSI